MSLDAARAFNRRFPSGTAVAAVMRDGSMLSGKLRSPAFVWSGLALVEIEGLQSYWTVDVVRLCKMPSEPLLASRQAM